MGVAEELACDDVRVTLNQCEVLAVETILKPVQGLSAVVALVNAGRDVTEDVHLSIQNL